MDAFFKDGFALDTYSVSSWTPTVMASLFSGLMPWEHGVVKETLYNRGNSMGMRTNKKFSSAASPLARMEKLKVMLSGNHWMRSNFGFGGGFNIVLPASGGGGSHGDEINSRARIMLDPLKNSNYFFFLHYMDTHQPYLYMEDGMVDISEIRAKCPADAGKDPLYGRDLAEEIQVYNSSVVAADVHFGFLMSAFDENKLMENTIVALFSDHGEELRDHGRIKYPRHGHSLYNELIDVPLLVHVPEPLRDFVKQQLERFEGRRFQLVSLIPMLDAISNRREFDPAWFPEIFTGYTGFDGSKAFIIENEYKLIRDLEKGSREFYNLESDPLEKAPVSGAGDEVERLERKLFEMMPRDFRGVEQEFREYNEDEMAEFQERLKKMGYM